MKKIFFWSGRAKVVQIIFMDNANGHSKTIKGLFITSVSTIAVLGYISTDNTILYGTRLELN